MSENTTPLWVSTDCGLTEIVWRVFIVNVVLGALALISTPPLGVAVKCALAADAILVGWLLADFSGSEK